MEKPLFAKDDLGTALQAKARDVAKRMEQWDPNALLKAPEADVVDELIGVSTVKCPRLLRDQAWMPEPSEIAQKFSQFDEVVERRVMRFVLVMPFDGEADVFTLRANTSSYNPPRVVGLGKNELRIAVDGPVGDGASVRALFEAQLDEIEKHLEWSRQQIEQHNERMCAEISTMVPRRRAQVLAARKLQAEIGFPIYRRPDADTYTVPIKRRKLRTVGPSGTPSATAFKPEPAMADRDYWAALTVLRNSRNALERTPSLAEKLGEQQIRDLLLVNLNAHFEGDAAGEVFNGAGKTDILIRVDDRNIFIGECKIWDGPSTMNEALGQIFKYLVWRDTKAAILLFIRNKDVTAVVKKVIEKTEEHPNYKRRGPLYNDDQLDFVMHAQDDPEREIHLTLLPFALRTSATA
ncbi:MAG: hypothetical protein WCF33_18260 [Pseudonocardiaceae bacterium]